MQIPVSAKNANGMLFLPNSAGIAITPDATETAITALKGTRSRLTRRKIAQPGMPRSRENAYQVRDALVRPAAPQNSWPIVAMIRISFAAHESSALVKIEPTKPAASFTASTSFAAKRKASRTNQPISAEKKTDRHTPCAAAMAAPFVSSAVCADASYPVCVYIASRKPIGSTRNQKPMLPVEPSMKPRVVDPLAEDEAGALVVVRHEHQQADDDRDAEHVPADGDVVHQRQAAVGEDVHDRVEHEDQEEQQPRLAEDVLACRRSRRRRP